MLVGSDLIIQRFILQQLNDPPSHPYFVFRYLALLYEKDLEIIRPLVSTCADFSSNNVGGFSALQSACDDGNIVFVKELLNIGPKNEINFEGEVFGTPLYATAFRGRAEIVRIVLDSGADIDRGRNGESPLDAARADHKAVTELLERRGASARALRED